MTAFWMRAALAVTGILALQACTLDRPQYAPSEGYESPARLQPAHPQYPTQTSEPAPVDPHGPVARPSQGVTSEPLPPPASRPAPGPVSLYGARLFYASTQPVFISTTPAAWRRRASRRERAVHVDKRGRLQADATQRVRVKKGDTVKSLAARYGTTERAILKANHIRHPGDLAVGQPLIVPQASVRGMAAGRSSSDRSSDRSSSGKPKVYRALRGDTIYSIGRRFKISPKEIEALNGFAPTTHLRTGELVMLPGGQAETAGEPGRQAVAAIHGPPAQQAAITPRERPHTTISGPVAGAQIIEPPITGGGPDHPIPYTSLPGHLATPPARPYVAPVVAIPQPPPPPPAADVVLAGRGRFIWPVQGTLISGFGPKPGGARSDGLDISATAGASVHAAAAGDVVYAGALPDLGNLVLIKHEDGWITAYAHLARAEVKIRDHVSQGDEVGLVGSTGSAAQPEVYFEIRYAPTPRDKARPVDPALLLSSQ